MSSESNRRRWANIPKEVRSARMRDIALFKWFMTSAEDRKVHALKMVKAKKLKVKSESRENKIKILIN